MEQHLIYRFDEGEFRIEDPVLNIFINESSAGCASTSTSRHDGTVMLVSNFKNDRLHGPSRAYFANGTLASERWFYQGKAHGQSLEYSISGSLLSRKGYVQGRLEGKYLLWHSSGKLQLSGFFHNGLPDGLFELFHTDGLPLRTVTFTGGHRNGLDTGWTEEGYLLFCELWAEGDRQRNILPDGLARSLGVGEA